MSFETEVQLSLSIADGDLRSARRTIENELGGVSVAPDGGVASRAAGGGGGGGGGRRQRRMFRWARERTNMMDQVVTLLGDIEEKVGEGGGGGGGGLLGGIGSFGLGRLSTVSITGLVTGSLGSIGGYLTGASITTFITGSLGSISSYLAGTTIGSFITGGLGSISAWITGVSLSALITGAGAVGSLLYGIVSLSDVIDGDISGWNLPGRFGMAMGQAVRDNFPNAADIIQDAFTKNPVFDLGKITGDLIFNRGGDGGGGNDPTGTTGAGGNPFGPGGGQSPGSGQGTGTINNPPDVTVSMDGNTNVITEGMTADDVQDEIDSALDDFERRLERSLNR